MDRIPHVGVTPGKQRMIWAFWGAAALAALGGLMPVLFAGTSGRLTGVVIPFWVAAVALGACAVIYEQGRVTATVVYFIAGLAIVFGLLAMFSLPLRLAVLGTCPAAPAPCTTGLPRPLTDAENTGMGVAATLGILAVFVGFFGLSVLYRRTTLPPTTPPERRIPPMPAHATVHPPAAGAAEPGATAVDREPEPTAATATPEALEEPAEPEELEELPPHREEVLPELPAPESSTPTN